MLRTSPINRCHAAGDRAPLMAHRQPRHFCRLARVARVFGDNANFLAINGLRLVSPNTRWGDTRRHTTELAPRRPLGSVAPPASFVAMATTPMASLSMTCALCRPKRVGRQQATCDRMDPSRQQSPRTSSLFLFPFAPTRSV
jgi:hypothetical protein